MPSEYLVKLFWCIFRLEIERKIDNGCIFKFRIDEKGMDLRNQVM